MMSTPIVISHHVKAIGLEYPPNALIRVNIAWAGSSDEVRKIIEDIKPHKIYLDYPTGRTKPPTPVMDFTTALDIANEFVGDVTHFAFSNAWDATPKEQMEWMRKYVKPEIKLVPKIETKGGIDNLKEVIDATKTDMVMLDAEDLYVNCQHNPTIFNEYKTKCREGCKALGVTCIELKGVVFGYEAPKE